MLNEPKYNFQLRACRPLPSWKENVLSPSFDHACHCSHPGARLSPWSHNTSNFPAGEAWPAAAPGPSPGSSGSSTGTAHIQDRAGLAELSLLQEAHTRDDSNPVALAPCNDEHLRNTITCLGHAKRGCKSEIGISPPETTPKTPQVKQNINSLACCR